MSTKPICWSDEIIKGMVAEFEAHLRSMKSTDGTVSYSRKIDYGKNDSRKVDVVFTPEAYFKMLSLVQNFSTEVAWNGTVERCSNNTFLINDILVYPQTVTGATVNTDQEKFQTWMNELDDDTINSLRFHGHSHVNMGAYFSGTDDGDHASHIAAFNRPDQFFIFMVINKKLEFKVRVFDMASNTLFEDDSVEVRIAGVDFSDDTFIKEAKSVVETKSYSSAGSSGWPHTASYGDNSHNWPGCYGGKGNSKKSDKKKPDKKADDKDALGLLPAANQYDDDDDFDQPGYGRQAGIWEDIQS